MSSHFHEIQNSAGRRSFKKCEVTTAACPLDQGTPEELGLWFGVSVASTNAHTFLTWLERHRAEKTLLEEQLQRSDDLAEALQGTTMELISSPTEPQDKIDVVKYDDQGNRLVVGEAVVSSDGRVTVVKARVDPEKLGDILQTEFDKFSMGSG